MVYPQRRCEELFGVGGMNSKTVVEVALFFIEFEVYNGLLIDIV